VISSLETNCSIEQEGESGQKINQLINQSINPSFQVLSLIFAWDIKSGKVLKFSDRWLTEMEGIHESMQVPWWRVEGGEVAELQTFHNSEFRNVDLLENDKSLWPQGNRGRADIDFEHREMKSTFQRTLCLGQMFKSLGKKKTEAWKRKLSYFFLFVKHNREF
jgi:hypothetical protein